MITAKEIQTCIFQTVELCKMLEAAGVDALDCGAGLTREDQFRMK